MPTDGSAHPSGRKRGYDLKSDYQGLTDEIVDLLGLSIAPLAITFHDTVPDGVKRFQGVFPQPRKTDEPAPFRRAACSGPKG